MYLEMVPGTENELRIRGLLRFSNKFSENTQEAVIRHFTTGLSIDVCALLFEIKPSNLNRSIRRLNEINHLFESLKEIEKYHLSEQAKIIKQP